MDKVSQQGGYIIWMAVGMAIYIATAVGHQQLDERISGLFSVEKIPYILYFILGTRARKNWSSMESLFDSKYGVAAFCLILKKVDSSKSLKNV